MMRHRALPAVCLGLAACTLACGRPDATPAKLQGRSDSATLVAAHPHTLAPRDVEEARSALSRIYADHFADLAVSRSQLEDSIPRAGGQEAEKDRELVVHGTAQPADARGCRWRRGAMRGRLPELRSPDKRE